MEEKLFTPGPLSTTRQVKKQMLHDFGSRDKKFIKLTSDIRKKLLLLINNNKDFITIPIQGSGTFAIEAALSSLITKTAMSLLIINGEYGRRMEKILTIQKKSFKKLEYPEDQTPKAEDIENILKKFSNIKNILTVHVETTTGIINPVETIGKIAQKYKCNFFVDAMSSFGAMDVTHKNINFDVIISSSNKCLEGVPGIAFVICKKSLIQKSQNNADSLCLDLYDQWQYFEEYGQWRFTPPVQVVAALNKALDLLNKEGGAKARYKRYKKNYQTLVQELEKLGLKTFLPKEIQSPIIVTFISPADKKFSFKKLYESLYKKGLIIYPGKLTKIETFRIGCIGNIFIRDIKRLTKAIKHSLEKMGIKKL